MLKTFVTTPNVVKMLTKQHVSNIIFIPSHLLSSSTAGNQHSNNPHTFRSRSWCEFTTQSLAQFSHYLHVLTRIHSSNWESIRWCWCHTKLIAMWVEVREIVMRTCESSKTVHLETDEKAVVRGEKPEKSSSQNSCYLVLVVEKSRFVIILSTEKKYEKIVSYIFHQLKKDNFSWNRTFESQLICVNVNLLIKRVFHQSNWLCLDLFTYIFPSSPLSSYSKEYKENCYNGVFETIQRTDLERLNEIILFHQKLKRARGWRLLGKNGISDYQQELKNIYQICILNQFFE